jgi:hypothetical protein
MRGLTEIIDLRNHTFPRQRITDSADIHSPFICQKMIRVHRFHRFRPALFVTDEML